MIELMEFALCDRCGEPKDLIVIYRQGEPERHYEVCPACDLFEIPKPKREEESNGSRTTEKRVRRQ